MKNRTAAGVFALFLGSVGAHKFYLGYNFQGLLYFLFCWTLIPGIIAFFEALAFFCMSDESFNRKFNSTSISDKTALEIEKMKMEIELMKLKASIQDAKNGGEAI